MKLHDVFGLLFESAREDFIKKTFGQKLLDASQRIENEILPVEDIIKTLSNADPTKNKQFLQWIARMYIANQFRLEDVNRLKGDLEEFERVKNKLDNKDLNSYKNLKQLYDMIEPFKEIEVVSNKEHQRKLEASFFENGEAEWFYRGETLKVLIPHSERASCFFGQNTKWCTAAQENNKFDSYSKYGPLYIVILKGGRRYQFQFQHKTSQFMDEQDQPIDIKKLAKDFPELKDAFDDIARTPDFGIIPLIKNVNKTLLANIIKNNGDSLQYVDCKDQTEELCIMAIDSVPSTIKFVCNQTQNIADRLIDRTSGAVLDLIDPKFKTFELCIKALKKAASRVPSHLRHILLTREIQAVPASLRSKVREELKNILDNETN